MLGSLLAAVFSTAVAFTAIHQGHAEVTSQDTGWTSVRADTGWTFAQAIASTGGQTGAEERAGA
ncbi:hypothetical protein [Streptomyces alanosinicus]|uniref:hypothetical protein n=1 Tax=Streptomyces alanosinicus TaxID=68171 RepID=UPI001679C3E0|nr:hypothetical protein [Streptomyces alanosinicus]